MNTGHMANSRSLSAPRFGACIRRLVDVPLITAACLALTGCLIGTSQKKQKGYANLNFILTKAEQALAKRSSSDTTFSLDSILVRFTAPGAATQTYAYPISGRPDTGAISLPNQIFALSPLRQWTVRVLTIDTTANPARRDTVHLDSLSLSVTPGDTVAATPWIRTVVSILRVRFVSASADSLPYGIRFIRLRVDGVVRDSVPLQGLTHNGIFFASTSTGFSVGDSGRFRKSTNGGTEWRRLNSGTTNNLHSLWFSSTSTGWIAGALGLIRKTTNGGTSWSTQATPTALSLKRIFFLDANKGFAFGDAGAMLKTVNGGSDWNSISGEWSPRQSGTTALLKGLHFTSATTGWIVGTSGTIRKTTDGGWTWSSQNTGSAQLNWISFSGTTGYVVGTGGALYRTTNGTSWSSQSSGVSSTLNGVFWNGSRGWFVGAGGVLRRTTNGTSWSSRSSGTTQALYGVFFRSNSLGWIVGASGTIRRGSNNNNNSWSAQNSGTTQQLNAVYFYDNNNGWVVGNNGTILRTTNGGGNWNPQTSGTTQPLNSVRFVSSTTGYASGNTGAILKTTNGGGTWVEQTSGTSQPLNGIFPVSADMVYATGASGTLLKTTRGGDYWTTTPLNDAFFRSDSGYVVGDDGLALRTRDGGESWSTLNTSTTQNLNAVFSSGTNVIAAGNGGIIRTLTHTSSGSNFSSRTSNTTNDLKAVWGSPTVGSTRFYVAGDDGEVRTVTSVTQSWSALTSNTTEDLKSLHCSGSGNLCWATGSNASVISTTNGTTWTDKTAGAKTFDELLTYKYLKPGVPHTIILGAMDHATLPLRGYQGSATITVGAGQDSTISIALSRCGGTAPACIP